MNELQIHTNCLKEETLILQQLEDLATLLTAAGHSCNFSGISYGKMGIVIFLFHYSRQTQNISFENTAEELINEIQTAIHIDFPISYTDGLTGIGTGIEYLAQHNFLAINTDEFLDDFDTTFAGQIHNRKLYLSYQDLTDMKRFFEARLENPQTKKREFLNQTMADILTLLELHDRVSVTFEEAYVWKLSPDDTANLGLEGQAGKGLTLLSKLDSQHNSWLKLRLINAV